jgi:NitT/TauT family transport system substrate-binding protein
MGDRVYSLVLAVLVIFLLTQPAAGVDKLKFATAIKASPNYYLPVLTAEGKGFWKENSLQAEWVPFRGAGSMFRSVASGAVKIGLTATPSLVQAASRGVPVMAASELEGGVDFTVWVRTDSPIRKPEDLKGRKIGVSRFGGSQHAYGRVVARALNLQKDITFISTGGIPAALAALRAAKIDAMVMPPVVMVKMIVGKKVRSLVPVAEYLPRPWSGHVVFAREDMIKENPAIIQRVVKAVLQAASFIAENPSWSMNKMKEVSGYSDEVAQAAYKYFDYSKDGKISPEALTNVRKFLMDFGIVKGDKAPAVADLYTDRFTR